MLEVEAPALLGVDAEVREHVDRLRRVGDPDAVLLGLGEEVLLAGTVVLAASELDVADLVAGGRQAIVSAGGGIAGELEDRAPLVGDERPADLGIDLPSATRV